jgi:8-oxo-dGTP diphosphatase
MPKHEHEVLEVAVAVVRNAQGHVLLAERTPRQISAGFWELPGGKIDAGETPLAAARRELLEEVGVHAEALSASSTYEHRFPTRRLRLHFFEVTRWRGEARGREGQRVAWADARHPPQPLLPSNVRMLARLSLAPLLVRVELEHGRDAWAECAAAVAHLPAIADVVFAAPSLPAGQRAQLGRRLAAALKSRDARLFLSGGVADARHAGLPDICSDGAELGRLSARPSARAWIVEAADSQALAQARALGSDAVIIPAAPGSAGRAPDWQFVRRTIEAARLPCYIAGALDSADLAAARAVGAIGIVVAADAYRGRFAAKAA